MYFNEFSCRIPEGTETSGGYVELGHNQHYTLQLSNKRNVPCDAKITIDGKEIGTFRVNANSTVRIEHPEGDEGRFTFFKKGTSEAKSSGIESTDADLQGLVQVIFTPAKKTIVLSWPYSYTITTTNDWNNYRKCLDSPFGSVQYTNTSNVYCSSVSEPQAKSSGSILRGMNLNNIVGKEAGITGLTGKSNQEFVEAAAIDYDYEQQTTISLRLVYADRNRVRPLVSKGNPVPPALG